MKNAGKACNNRLYRHIRTFEKIVKNYFVIYSEIYVIRVQIFILVSLLCEFITFRRKKGVDGKNTLW